MNRNSCVLRHFLPSLHIPLARIDSLCVLVPWWQFALRLCTIRQDGPRAKRAVYETAQKISTGAVVMQIISRSIDGQKKLDNVTIR